jgi:MYXO-CTERM domain-containing protein
MNTSQRLVVTLCLALAFPARAAVMPTPQAVETTGEPPALAGSVGLSGSNGDAEMTFVLGHLGQALQGVGFTVAEDSDLQVYFHRFGDAELWPLPARAQAFPAMGEEGYVLVAEPVDSGGTRVIVAAATAHGLFNGGMTLLGLLVDGGEAAATLQPQIIEDYPDHLLRGGYLYSVGIKDEGSGYVVTDAVKARVDELARMKVNMVFMSEGQIFSYTDGSWERAKGALLELQGYCRQRFIELVPSAGSLRNNASLVDYRDGWRMRREPFHFENRTETDEIVTNGSFEDADEATGGPLVWTIKPIVSGGSWVRDTAAAHTGSVSMRLDAADSPSSSELDSTSSLILSQVVRLPRPGRYLLSAFVKTQDIADRQVQVTVYGTDILGKVATEVVSAYSPLGTSDWTEIRSGVLTVGEGVPRLTVYSRIQEPGHGAAWIDDVRILEVVDDGSGNDVVVEPQPVTREIAVADNPEGNLVVNSSMEVDGDTNGMPDGWTAPYNNAQAGWTWDATQAGAGSHSMRLDVESGASSNNVTLVQDVADPVPGTYLVTALVKADGVVGYPPQVTAYSQDGSGAASDLGTVNGDEGTTLWHEHGLMVRLAQPHDRLRVYSRLMSPGHGTFRVDGVYASRVNPMLRNVNRKAYDIKVESEDLSTTYALGTDYEVVDALLSAPFSRGMRPTRIVRLPGGAIPDGAHVLLSYDANLYWASPHDESNQGWNLCTSQTLEEVFKPAVTRIIRDLGPRAINLNSDEIRGFNRSGACYDEEGNLRSSNAELLASYFNELVAYARALDPEVQVYAWDDMLSSVHNGGDEKYQVQYGGPPGRTDEAVSQDLLTKDLRMMVWWYGQTWLWQMVASTDFFRQHGHQMLAAPHHDAANIADWSAVSTANPAILGVLVTPWTSEEGMPPAAELFWNAPWRQVFFSGFEAAEEAALLGAGYAFDGAAAWSRDGSCAAPTVYPKGINPGGVCVGAAGGTVTLPPVAVDPTRSYQLKLHTRVTGERSASWHVVWELEDGTTVTDDRALTLSGDGSFVRTSIDLAPPAGAAYLRAAFTVAAGEPAVALDNVMLWEEHSACLRGELSLSAPPVIDLGVLSEGETRDFAVSVCNAGCRTLHVEGVAVDPASGAVTVQAPAAGQVLAPGECLDVAAHLEMPGGAAQAEVTVSAREGASSTTSVTASPAAAPSDGSVRPDGPAGSDAPGEGSVGGDCSCRTGANAASTPLLLLLAVLAGCVGRRRRSVLGSERRSSSP